MSEELTVAVPERMAATSDPFVARVRREHSSLTLGPMRVGSILMVSGAALVVLGALVRFAPGLFSWFGNLPGDVRVDSGNSRVFIPLTSMILASIALTVVANLVGWFFRSR